MNRAAREPGLFWPALWRLALAGACFVGIYTTCNRYTATRTDVSIWMWEWERHMPFIPELVVPYWSLDLFFCGAFFLCASRVELNLLTKRIIAVTVASGICFLLIPLRMGLDRPVPSGWTAPLFHALYLNDLPHNLAPSLHISLRSLVWVFYGAHLTGWWRRLTKAWFILIGASTLLVWQHHLIDVASGFVMGWAIAALIPNPRQHAVSPTPSPKLAWRYGIGAVLFGLLALAWFGFAWPAVALGIMALTYATGRSRLLGKENGTLSPGAEWCLLPVLLAARWIQRKWLQSQPPWHEVTPGVQFGRRPTNAEAARLVAESPLAVLDMTAESNATTAFREHTLYHNIALLDLVQPAAADIKAAVAFIRQVPPGHRVLIHCQLGLQRSATVAAHWLVACGAAPDLPAAFRQIEELNPDVVLHPESVT